MKPLASAAALGLAASLAWPALPAEACLSCGCGGSGTSADLGAVGGASSLFSMGHRWLIQEGISNRAITGSFNDLGTWNPTPVGGSLNTVSASLGLTYFPMVGASLGLQIPGMLNALDKAAWGPLGSIAPTDLSATSGGGLGDISFQGTYKFYEGAAWALAAWGGGSLPTGRASGDPASYTGAGVFSGQAGLIGLTQLGDWEFSANLGYQRPFGRPADAASVFYVGEAWLYQLQGNYRLSDAWRVGLGLNGYRGTARYGTNDQAQPMSKLKLMPSVQWAWDMAQGVRLAAGYDPTLLGTNSMTDLSVYAVFYQYMP